MPFCDVEVRTFGCYSNAKCHTSLSIRFRFQEKRMPTERKNSNIRLFALFRCDACWIRICYYARLCTFGDPRSVPNYRMKFHVYLPERNHFMCHLCCRYFRQRRFCAHGMYVSVRRQGIAKRIYRNLITLSIVIQWKIHNSFCAHCL